MAHVEALDRAFSRPQANVVALAPRPLLAPPPSRV
jgi:hypothetical protein